MRNEWYWLGTFHAGINKCGDVLRCHDFRVLHSMLYLLSQYQQNGVLWESDSGPEVNRTGAAAELVRASSGHAAGAFLLFGLIGPHVRL